MSAKNNNHNLLFELKQLLEYVNQKRKRQLLFLLLIMIFSSLSEVVSLGSVLPFLGALGNADKLLENKYLLPWFEIFSIQTPSQLISVLAAVFIFAVITANALRILTINIQTHLAASISSDLSCQLYKKTILQPYSFHVSHNSSQLVNVVTVDSRALTTVLVALLSIVTNSFVIVALIIGLCLIDARIALAAAVLLGGAYITIYRVRRKLLAYNSQTLVQCSQQQIKTVQESLGGIRDVLLGDIHSHYQSTYQQADTKFRHAAASNKVIGLTPRYVIECIAMTAIGLFALLLSRDGDFSSTLPVLGSLALGANRLLPALQHSFSALASIQGSRESLRRVIQGLERSVETFSRKDSFFNLEFEEGIHLKNIWFRYGTEKEDWILRDLNLYIPARSTVGFIGSTGSGKSTTIDLILGLLQPQKGSILIDDKPLTDKNLRQWQKNVAHVPQSIFLSDATIAENIAFGIRKDSIDFERVHMAAQLAKIDEFIRELPAKYETYVGERGVRLSGGQRQRIGIARALYQQASVIVFDEATSALDNEMEKEVMEAINGLSHKYTVIMIAHRLTTVSACDCVFSLEKGRIVAQGKLQNLLDEASVSKT
ncbi:abc transporter atp-binding protein [Leptolyngbya sp. Heron Island J]|uniref:ABC transporter ATP-binding protein n=1 Tax=Leptolyngbya sp. Heron Island J TaxID=1385935 RepID=UPI0003B9EA17|nr:ABC transporter ATP-binding protein [Leptolyngbya sp. Heron Island J]ESA38751.1 abc transporter atp-binding protein [Leptolyngbya sp. Heron Island J]